MFAAILNYHAHGLFCTHVLEVNCFVNSGLGAVLKNELQLVGVRVKARYFYICLRVGILAYSIKNSIEALSLLVKHYKVVGLCRHLQSQRKKKDDNICLFHFV